MQKNIYDLGIKQRTVKSLKKAVSFVTGLSMILSITSSSTATMEVHAEGPTAVTAETVEWSAGTYEVGESVTVESRITVTGDVNLILSDGKNLIATKGITVAEGNSLTITGGSEGTGILYVGTTDGSDSTADEGNAGIGGLADSSCGEVTINGGVVFAYGGDGAMGIGRGAVSDNSPENGTLTAGENVTLYTSDNGSDWAEAADTTTRTRYMKAVYTALAPPPTYTVTITGAAHATPSGNTTQPGLSGPMDTVIFTAEGGYQFPAFLDIVVNGITATRTNATTVTVSGTPNADADIEIPDAESVPHTHSWTFSQNGATVTARCTADCPDNYDEAGVPLSLTASSDVYDGNAHGADLDSAEWVALGIIEDTEIPEIYYAGVGTTVYESSTTEPTDAGTYSASITVKTSYTATLQFAITPATLTGVSVAQEGTLTYTGSAQTPEVTEEATAVNGQEVSFTYSTTEGGVYGAMPTFTNVGDCGTVYYKASAPNHSDATGSFTVTMGKADRGAPAAPTADETATTINSITLNAIEDGEYRIDGGEWQSETLFEGLAMNTQYTFYQRYAETDNYNVSEESAPADISTNDHVHDYSYAAEGATITETCDNTDNGHGSEAPAQITIVAPTLSEFGGEGSPNATISGSLYGVPEPTIVYKKGYVTLDAAPTDAGTYTANITLTGVKRTGGDTGSVTASVEYTIAPKAVSVEVSISETSFAYGAEIVTPTVTVTIEGSGTVLTEGTDYDIEYVGVNPAEYPRSTTPPEVPGTYYVVVTLKGNYSGGATCETSYTIERGSANIISLNQTITYDGSEYNLTNLFDFRYVGENVGKTFMLVSGTTGTGRINGSSLIIERAGEIRVKVITEATETVASTAATAVLTVNKGTATGSITVADVSYGEVVDPEITCDPEIAGHKPVEYKAEEASDWSATKPSSVGNYRARVTIGGNDLFEETVVSCEFEIKIATLTVKADDKSKVRDKADPALTYTVVSGLAAGDRASSVLIGAIARESGETAGTYEIGVGTLEVVGTNYLLNFIPGTFTITKAIHSDVTVSAAKVPAVPTVATTGLTIDVKSFISPAPAEESTYAVTEATGVVVASPLPSMSGSLVIYSVLGSEDKETGSIKVTVTDPNYEPYEVTIPIKASLSANCKTETTFTNTGVADNSVTEVVVAGLDKYAVSQADSDTAVEVVLEVEKKEADAVDEDVKSGILSAVRSRFISLGYGDSDLKRAYLDIDLKKYTAADLSSLNTSGAFDSVPDTTTPIEIALKVGTDMTAKKPVVVRVHGTTTLAFSELTSRPKDSYADGKFYVDKSAGIIYVYTRFFSVYSLVYAGTTPVTVTFNSAGGSAVSSVTIKPGNAISKPTDPTRSGYTFGGWLLGGGLFDFTTPVTANISLTAKWTLASSGTGTGAGSSGAGAGAGARSSGSRTTGSGSRSSGASSGSRSTSSGTGSSTRSSSTRSSSSGGSTYSRSSGSGLFSYEPIGDINNDYYSYSNMSDADDFGFDETDEEFAKETGAASPALEEEIGPDTLEVTEFLPDEAEPYKENVWLNVLIFAGAIVGGLIIAGILGWLLFELKRSLKEYDLRTRSRAV